MTKEYLFFIFILFLNWQFLTKKKIYFYITIKQTTQNKMISWENLQTFHAIVYKWMNNKIDHIFLEYHHNNFVFTILAQIWWNILINWPLKYITVHQYFYFTVTFTLWFSITHELYNHTKYRNKRRQQNVCSFNGHSLWDVF